MPIKTYTDEEVGLAPAAAGPPAIVARPPEETPQTDTDVGIPDFQVTPQPEESPAEQFMRAPGRILGVVSKGAESLAGGLAGFAPSGEEAVESVMEGKPLPVEQAAERLPWYGRIPAKIGLGFAENTPRIAALAAVPGGFLAHSAAAGGLFGVDDQGRFNVKSAVIGALMPSVGLLARRAVSSALAKSIESGSTTFENPLAQKTIDVLGQQAALNAYMAAADSPELLKEYQESPKKAAASIATLVGQNLAWGLLGVPEFSNKVPSAAQRFIIDNAEKYANAAEKLFGNKLWIPNLEGRKAAMQQAYEEALQPTRRITLTVGEQPTEERTTDATGIGQQRSSEETQLPRVREGQNVPPYPAEVRQEESGQAASSGGPEPSAQGQAANPPDELLDPVQRKYPPGSPIRFYWPEGGSSHGVVMQHMPSGRIKIRVEGEEFPVFISDRQIREDAPPPAPAPAPPAPEPAPAAQAPAPAAPPAPPIPPVTLEAVERGKALIDQAMTLVRTRNLSAEDRSALGGEIENIRKGDLTGMQAQLERLKDAPLKPVKVARAFSGIEQFDRESEQLRGQIGEEDILDWIRNNNRMLSRSAALKRWGKQRFNQNKSLWDDAPTDLPMHHQMAIYSPTGDTPDNVAKAAARAGILRVDPNTATERDLWAAIDHASKTRRGATPEAEREARVQSEDERQFREWQDRTRQAEPGKEVPVTAERLGVGDKLEVDGQQIEVTEVDPDTGDVTLDDGQKFGVQKVREGEAVFYVQRLEKAAEADFTPEEPAAEPAKLELPKVPGPLPKGIPKADREEAFRQQRERWDKYNADVAAWEAAQPQNKPIIFRRANGSHSAITPDPQGGWRVTTFTKLYSDLDKLAPWGHERYNTRLEAVQGMLHGGRDGEIVDSIPEVMTEEDIRQENERRNAPAPAAREIEPMRLSGETKKFKKTDWGALRVVSEPTGKQPQIRVDEDGTRWAWKRSNPSNVWADRVLPEREIITPANDRQIGVNAAGEQLYERADGSVYRMRFDRGDRPNGYPDFGGDLAPFPHEPPPATPTLRPGETAGELFQGADQPFNLAGQTGVDADRIAAERAAAEARAKEAADLAARQQPELPTAQPMWHELTEEQKAEQKARARSLTVQQAVDAVNRKELDVNALTVQQWNAVQRQATETIMGAGAGEPEESPEPPKPAGAAAGTRVGKYVKGEDGWYLVDEQGNRRNLPRANKKISARLEGQAAAPPAPAETRSPVEILNQATRIRVRVPDGATMIRVTDAEGRTSIVSVEDANRGENVFRGADPAKIEAGFINSKRQFQKVKGEVTVEDTGRKTQSLEAAFPPGRPAKPVMTPEQVTAHIQQMFPGSQMIRVVNDPAARMSGQAHFDENFTKLLGIDVNAAAMRDAAHIKWVVEHEIAHAADKLGDVRPLLDGITDGEFMAILNDVKKRDYKLDAYGDEIAARSLQMLAADWKGRSWFEKLLGAILKLANDVGYKMTRLAAEKLAAKAMADATKLISDRSEVNSYSVTRTFQSLPLNAEEWSMKRFFDTLGLQAATIGGYLHRYTRQVEKAEELAVTDRARALDGMNQARELTELAQGMGGRANYYDAIANATSEGERSEVLGSAFDSISHYQWRGIDLRQKLDARREELNSESFRNKLERASRRRERAELAAEARQTFTQQMGASAGVIAQTLNNLRTIGAASEQMQADLARVQQLPGFDAGVAQRFDTIVNALAQSDRGISLLIAGGSRDGADIWNEYLATRFAAGQGIPQGDDFVLGQLASAVLSVNRDLRNQAASLSLLARDIITAQEWNRAASKIAQALQNDPVKAIPRILERAGNLGEREARAEAAYLALNRGIEHTLRDFNDYDQAVRLHDAVEADTEYKRWVNAVMNNPAIDGLLLPADARARMAEAGAPDPFFKYSGHQVYFSPQGTPYRIDMQWSPEQLQGVMRDFGSLRDEIDTWLRADENQHDPTRKYWTERRDLLENVMMSSSVWNPGAIHSLFWKGSFGIPENFFQQLALPSANLAFVATKSFDRYFTQGTGWYGSNRDVSESTLRRAFKGHGYNELQRKDYQQSYLNPIAWAFRNGREVHAGDVINGHTVTETDLSLLRAQGRMTNDVYERMWNTAKVTGAQGVMELPRLMDTFTGDAWGIRRPMEIGVQKNTTLPHSFSEHGKALAYLIHMEMERRNREQADLAKRVVAEAMTPEQRNAAAADITNRYYESLEKILDDPDRFANAVLGFMSERSENWVKLDGLSPFEQHYRDITQLVSSSDPTAPKTVQQVLDYITQRVPAEMTPEEVRAKFFGEWEKLVGRFEKMNAEAETGVRVTSDKRPTAFTQGWTQDLGPAYFYDYGWVNDGEMRRLSTDLAEFGYERMMESLRALKTDIAKATSELTGASPEVRPEIVKRTDAQYREGKDFRNLQLLQQKAIELDRIIAGMPKYVGQASVQAEGISLKSWSRPISLSVGGAVSGPRTSVRVAGLTGGGSAWKMGLVMMQLGYGRIRSWPSAAVSAIQSTFRLGASTMLGWYFPEKGFVPGIPLRLLLNIPKAGKAALANQGTERIYRAIEEALNGTTDEQFAALSFVEDQRKLGMIPNVFLGSRVANILSSSRTKGGVMAGPTRTPTTTAGNVWAATKLAVSKPWAMMEAFIAGTNVYLPGAFGYNVTYDAVARKAGSYIDMLGMAGRKTFENYERLGQLDRFNFDNLTDPKNKLQPWEVLPTFSLFRFVDPSNLPAWARPNSTNLQAARELFRTSTDTDLQDLLIRYFKRLSQTPPEERGAVEFLAPEETDPQRATERAEARARGIISRFVEQTHHSAPSNRPHYLRKATQFQAIMPFAGWTTQTIKLIDTALGKAAFSAERDGVSADTLAGLIMAGGLTGLFVLATGFLGGESETHAVRELDRLLHHKEGTVKTIEETSSVQEAAEVTLHDVTAGVPVINGLLNSILGLTGYRGGSAGFQGFVFDKINSFTTYARDVYRTRDITHGLDRLIEANFPITETLIENMSYRQGLQNNRNAVRVLQKLGPQDLVERRASLSIALPTEMTPFREALLEAIGSGDQKQVADAYQAFIQKATELGRTEPDKLARQMFSTLNPYRQAFGGVLTDQQRADTLGKASATQREMVETMEKNYALAAATLGLTADFEKQEKAPPLQRSAGAASGVGALSLGSSRAAGGGSAGIGRIGTGLRRVSLSGPKPPRIRLPGGLGVSRAQSGSQSARATPLRNVRGRLRARSTKARRLSVRAPRARSRRRISLSS